MCTLAWNFCNSTCTKNIFNHFSLEPRAFILNNGNREYVAQQSRSMNNRFHSEAKLPWSYDYPLANHIATNKAPPIVRCPCLRAFTVLSGMFGKFSRQGNIPVLFQKAILSNADTTMPTSSAIPLGFVRLSHFFLTGLPPCNFPLLVSGVINPLQGSETLDETATGGWNYMPLGQTRENEHRIFNSGNLQSIVFVITSKYGLSWEQKKRLLARASFSTR